MVYWTAVCNSSSVMIGLITASLSALVSRIYLSGKSKCESVLRNAM